MNRSLLIDSNIYVKAHVEDRGPSLTIIEAAAEGAFTVVVSDQLVEEIHNLFQKLFGREQASRMRASLLAFPALRVVDKHEWRRAKPLVGPFTRDRSDLPHYAAGWVAGVEALVSVNRRSILPGMFDLVPLTGPEPIAEAIEGKGPWPTRDEMLADWRRWARSSPRAPKARRRDR